MSEGKTGMKRPRDQIRAAYYNELGAAFGKKVRSRVHWIIREAKGRQILDIGCSGGIIPILLGREGKEVLGLDISPEAIEEANQTLGHEAESVRELVAFVEANFMTYEIGQRFDSVLMTEVLEHIGEPERFIERAHSLTKAGGRMIVTVPFGVNDYQDHKRTYYLRELIEQLTPYGEIQKVERIDKWLGIALETFEEKMLPRQMTEEEIAWLEDAFEATERRYLEEIISLKTEVKKMSSHEEEAKRVHVDSKRKTDLIESLEHDLKIREERNIQLTEQYKELLERYESALTLNQGLMEATERWKTRYQALANSKLGKLAKAYWKIRRTGFRRDRKKG
ncbi:class I SAM-dependent methyltransferase [Exiguobacterium flavidum]|uniref:class I SAM-dependent methyltransferase n=1 Tax=Exiguobacterium flavidum TaxID=2184695 RepID=UPI001E334350|nr:methyltransferase domain-containing protein [Exiguobacterium flavidum]